MAADIQTRPIQPVTPRTASRGAVLAGVFRGQRRSLILWGIAVAAVSTIYIAFYPAIGEQGMEDMAGMIPEDLAAALGYDRLGDAAGYLTATVYGLLGPALLLVFGIAAGARLIAGQEEDGTLELEFTHPVGRRSVYGERLVALWASLLVLTAVLGAVALVLVLALDMDVRVGGLLAATSMLLLFVGMHATLSLAVGAATGRRAIALGAAAGIAVLGYLANALGPMVDVGWLTAVSPWAWFLEADPVAAGFDPRGAALLAGVSVVAAVGGAVRFDRRDLGV